MEHINDRLIENVAKELNIRIPQVISVLDLLEEGNTVPFIARYRKEKTGSLDEEDIRKIEKEYEYGKNLAERKEQVLRLIDEKDMLTDELKNEILACEKLVDVEDLYRPYKEKKKTKATEAINKGLEPLAKAIMAFPKDKVPEEMAEDYVNDDVPTIQDALEGAGYIIAEWVSDEASYRKWIRTFTMENGLIVTKKKKNAEDPYQTYKNYYAYEEPLKTIKLYRILAINRAEKEKVITVKIDVDQDKIFDYLYAREIGEQDSPVISLVEEAIKDSYKRLISGAIEREIRSDFTEKAEEQAIHVFSENLKSLLLQAPLKGKIVMGIDPAFRTGCKFAVIDPYGLFVRKGVIYPHETSKGKTADPKKVAQAKATMLKTIDEEDVEIIAIGNGTASRETEAFIADLIKENNLTTKYVIVSEAGASVYSASETAREEFPDFAVEERSAVSIARRLQDPLSELVKIDPKAIGVGQYQHDVTQSKLEDSLDFVVTSAVNQVGVNVNTASSSLLKYVSGLSSNVAKNIVTHREENGPFTSRDALKDVKQFGPKTFEQAIGFLRIMNSENPFDATPIHPESYDDAKRVLAYLELMPEDIGTKTCIDKIERTSHMQMAEDLDINTILLQDILDAFEAPTRDVRDDYPQPLLKSELLHLKDMKSGMKVQGTIRNVVDFGAFVDVGIKEAGLVHISKLSKRYVKHPMDVVSVGDIVTVWVVSVDIDRKRLQLTMLDPTKE